MPDEESVLTEDVIDRAARNIPSEKLSRYLSRLGKNHEFMEAMNTEFGKRFIARLNSEWLRLENIILSGADTDPKVQKARVEYEIRKEDSEWVMAHYREYDKDVKTLRKAGQEKI